MRLVGVALTVSVLCAACALQPADVGDEGAPGAAGSQKPTAPRATYWGAGTPTAGGGALQVGGSSGNAAPAQLTPQAVGGPTSGGSTCTDPGGGCGDPHPQPWSPGGIPVVVKP